MDSLSCSAAFYHHHHSDDLPHLHLSAAPAAPHDDSAVQSPPQGDHVHGHHLDHNGHEQHESGHWHFAAPAAIVPLLVLALLLDKLPLH